MTQLPTAAQLAEWGSASLVILASSIVGHQAAQGMGAQQWACSAFAVLGSVSVAVVVRVWPSQSKATAQQ